MKSEEIDLKLLDELITEAKAEGQGMIPILQRAQNVYGYLPKEVLNGMAEGLSMPRSRVYGVATFYSQFHLEPRGRHIIQQCDGTACHVSGAREIIARVEQEYGIKPGETTEDLKLTFELVYCLGCCAIGPAAIVDGEVVGHLTPDKMLEIIDGFEEYPEYAMRPEEELLLPVEVLQVPIAEPVALHH